MKIKTETLITAIRKVGFIKVDDLARQFSVSPSSIRRKLVEIEKNGLVIRTHGGVKPADDDMMNTSFTTRIHTNVLEKKLVALKALKFVSEGNVIFIDASSTTYFMTAYLSEFSNITVITNCIDTLAALAEKGVKVISTGGTVTPDYPSILVGSFAKNTISEIHADLCFFSVHGISDNGVIYDSCQENNEVVREMIRHSDKSVCLCDYTKFGKKAPYKLCDVSDVDYIVSDRDLGGSFEWNTDGKLIF